MEQGGVAVVGKEGQTLVRCDDRCGSKMGCLYYIRFNLIFLETRTGKNLNINTNSISLALHYIQD